MTYTDEQIENAAETIHRVLAGPGVAWDNISPEARQLYRRAMHAILATPTPAEDPNLVRWTPADGPLVDALAGLPDGHPVTIEGPGVHLEGFNVRTMSERGFGWKLGHMTRYIWGDDFTGVTSASWLPPGPAWDGALVVSAETIGGGDPGCLTYLIRNRSNLYAANPHQIGWTAAKVVTRYGRIRVLIDADGNHVEVPHA